MTVFLLWHMRPLELAEPNEEVETDDKLCGVFSSRQKALVAQVDLSGRQGFREYPDAFLIDELPVDEVFWTEGFVTLDSSDETRMDEVSPESP